MPSFDGAKSVVMAQFSQLNIHATEDLRREMRKAGSTVMVTKKTLLRKVLQDAGIEGIELGDVRGTVMLAFGVEDEVSPAKILYALAKKNEVVDLFAGVLEGATLKGDRVKALAILPSKNELIAKTVYTLQAPLSGFVQVLAGNIRGLVQVLNAIVATK